MPYLNITLTGICAFTPAAPVAGDLPNETVTVVMPSSSRRISQAAATLGEVIPLHQPFIIANVADVPNEAAGRRADVKSPQGQYGWLLSRERISPSVIAPAGVRFKRVGGNHGTTPNSDEEDVYWIADMRWIWDARSKIQSAFAATTGAIGAAVAAQLVLGGGSIRSEFIEKPPYPHVDFDPIKTSQIHHTLTRWVVVSYDLGNQFDVSLNLTSLVDGVTTLGAIDLYSGGGDIDVFVGNASVGDFVAIMEKASTRTVLGADAHFELYYDVMEANNDPDLTVPVVSQQSLHSNCPPLMTKS